MRVKYNKELASELIRGKVKGEFYRRTEDGEEQVFPELITYKDEDLICLKRDHTDPLGGTVINFRTLSEGMRDAISIELTDFKVGDILAVDFEDGPIVGVLSGIEGVIIQTNCWSGLEEDGVLRIGEYPFCKVSDSRRPTDLEITKFLKIVDDHGHHLGKDNQLCKKEKTFEPFEKVLIYTTEGWLPKFFGFTKGKVYFTTDRIGVSARYILPYKGNEHLILSKKCD